MKNRNKQNKSHIEPDTSSLNHPYIESNQSKADFINDSIEGRHIKHEDNYKKLSKPSNKYYHNIKALENVLKEDKEAQNKHSKEKQQLMLRKQKVASYSKLVKEIHWDSNSVKRKDLYDANGRRIKKATSEVASNKTFEDKRKTRMMAIDKIKDIKRKQIDDAKTIQEQGALKENVSENLYNDSDQNTSQNRKVKTLKNDIEDAVQKNTTPHNFIGINNSKFS